MNEVIIEELLNGELSYFNEFYEKTKYKLFYNILAILKDPVLSEDALQETYLKFLNNLNKLKKEKNILGYLMVVSRNVALDMLKKSSREVQIDDYNLSLINDNGINFEYSNILLKVKEILSDMEFQIFILHVINEMTHKEISRLLKKPLGSITWAYNNALKKLKKGLKDYEWV